MALLTEPNISSGKREDLANLIALADARGTPVSSMAKKGKELSNTIHSWQMDALPAIQTDGVVDGTPANAPESANLRFRQSAYVQTLRRQPAVSFLTEEVSDIAGVNSEKANQIAKYITMIKRDQEAVICSNNGMQADNGTVPYKTRGLKKWLAVAASKDTVLPTDDAYCLPSTSRSTVGTAALTESVVNGLLTSIWNTTGVKRDFDCFVGSALKQAFTNLVYTTPSTGSTNTQSAIRTFQRDPSEASYISGIDVFQGDFGTLKLHPSHWLNVSGSPLAGSPYVGYVLPMDKIEIRYGGAMAKILELPKDGSGSKFEIRTNFSLVLENPLECAIFDFTA